MAVLADRTTTILIRIISMYLLIFILAFIMEIFIQYRLPCKLYCISDFLVSTWVATLYSD